MSASTGTIQRQMGHGSILGAVAVGVATIFAVGALAWGAANLTASKQTATPVAAPAFLDKGSRADSVKLGPMPYSPAQVQRSSQSQVQQSTPLVGDGIVDKPAYNTPRVTTHASHPRHIANR